MKIHFLLNTLLWIFTLASCVTAQDSWQLRTSGVTVPLWSVAYGDGQWVAVGEQGTILTSTDGSTWIPRTSGFPARWLVGVGYGTPNGNGLWVVVGESGLILTSPDAVTWTARRTAGTRINAVAFGNGTFVAADDAGSTYYSLDGVTWSGGFFGGRSTFVRGLVYGAPHFVTTGLAGIATTYEGSSSTMRLASAPQLQGAAYGRRLYLATGGANTFTSRDALTWTQQSATTAIGVQGATFFNNLFVAVGNGGAIATTFDGSAWTARTSGTTQILLAVAGAPDSAIAVGFGGTILQSFATTSAPAVTVSPASVYEAAGGNVGFTASARGSAPFLYQWRKDGVDLPGATAESLFLAKVAVEQTGNYTCVVTNALGSTVSAPAAVTVATAFPPADPVDLTFALGITLSAQPRSAALQPDGKIIIGGSFLLLNEGQAQFGLARLNANGALDTTFKPGAIDPNGVVQTIVVQPDGKILIGGNFATINGVARNRVARLNADGSLDTTFVPAYTPTTAVTQLALSLTGRVYVVNGTETVLALTTGGAVDSTWGFLGATALGDALSTAQALDVQPDEKVVVVLRSFVTSGFAQTVRRVNANGTRDTTFANPGYSPEGSVRALRTLADGRILLATTLNGLTVQRISPQGLLESSTSPLSNLPQATAVAFTADGKTWFSGLFGRIGDVTRPQLARLNSDGSLDFGFNPGTGILNSSGSASAASFIIPLDDGRAIAGGDFNRLNGAVRPYLARLNAQSPGGANAPTVLPLDTYYREIRAGEPFTVQVNAVGSATLNYAASSPSGSFSAFGPSLVPFSNAVTTSSGAYTVSASNSVGATSAQIFYVRVIPSAPFVVAQPTPVQTNSGRPVNLTVGVGGSAGFTYQWFKNGSVVTSGNITNTSSGSSLTFGSPNPADSGDYTVVIRNSLGFATSQTVHLGVDETPRFVNIATRALAGRTDSPLIAGFVVAGPGTKRVMVRAVGPTLGSAFNLPGFLPDPVLSVYNSAGTLVYANDDWSSANDVPGLASAGTRLGAFTLGAASADAGGILTLSPGSYTAVVTAKNNATGLALVEVYEDDNFSSRLINLSSRAFVGTGGSVAIPGIVIRGGTVAKKLLVRAVGPGLTAFGVSGVLANPSLTITDSGGFNLATNDDWETNANVADLLAATNRVSFPLATGSKDAALLVTLPPGGYTVQVSGVGDASGNALVEVYELP